MRRCLSAIVVFAAFLLLVAPVLAGGWATVRLDEPPGEISPGEPWEFGFMVLQHDVTPNGDVTPVIRATHLESGDEVTATAEQEGPTGHFVAELTLPLSGEWSWTITPEPFAETTFPALVVSGAFGAEIERDADRPNAEATPTGSTETIEMTGEWLFAPARLEITPGTTVTWINKSPIVHSVALDDPSHTASELLDPGQSFSVTFDTPGTYHYRCSPHPGMEGTVMVAG
jgi:plastocyanin